MIFSQPESPWFYRVLNTVLLAVVAWLLAALFWLLVAPAPALPVAAPARVAAQPVVTAPPGLLLQLFRGTKPGPAVAAPSTLNYKLRGVIAPSSGSAAAAILQGNDPVALAVKLGGELQAGVRLVEIAADHVVVDNQGRRERIELDGKPAANIGAMPQATIQNNPIASGGSPPSTEGEVEVSRKHMLSGLQGQNITQWSKGLGDAPEGGILVDNPGEQPLAVYLGFQAGDVLRSVNGASLSKVGDISLLYGAFSRESVITVEALRNGGPVVLKFRVSNQ